MRFLACVVLLLLALVAPAWAAPGRVVVDIGLPSPARHVDSGGAGMAVALPDGAVLLVGSRSRSTLALVRLRADGSPDGSFGSGGVAHVALGGAPFFPLQTLRRPDGRLLVAGTRMAESRYQLPRLELVGLTAGGRLDRAFGDGGLATTGIQGSCGGCEPVALAPDGSIVLTGNTGTVSPQIARDPRASNSFRWVVARLTAQGRPDPSFGVRPVPGAREGDSFGYGTELLSDGRIVLLGTQDRVPRLARLRPDGSADPTFAGGSLAPVPLKAALHLDVQHDGHAVILGFDALARMKPDGAADPTFGDRGALPLPNRGFGRMLEGPRGQVVVYSPTSYGPRPAGRPAMLVERISADGARTRIDIDVPFGGGLASFRRARHRIVEPPPLDQNAFRVGQLVRRPDGSYVAAGGISVVQYTGEGAGFSTARFAAAALTPELRLDTSFGGAAERAAVALRVASQRARHARSLRGIAVRLRSSGAGLARVRVRDARGRVLADGVQPAYRAGTRTVRVQITRRGLTVLRRGRARRVRATATFRDLLTARVTARSSWATLR